MTGTMILLTYPGWYGKNELSDFEKQHSGLTVKTEESGTGGVASSLAQIEHNEGAYDLSLGGVPGAAQLASTNGAAGKQGTSSGARRKKKRKR